MVAESAASDTVVVTVLITLLVMVEAGIVMVGAGIVVDWVKVQVQVCVMMLVLVLSDTWLLDSEECATEVCAWLRIEEEGTTDRSEIVTLLIRQSRTNQHNRRTRAVVSESVYLRAHEEEPK